jgi:hypothetical protein
MKYSLPFALSFLLCVACSDAADVDAIPVPPGAPIAGTPIADGADGLPAALEADDKVLVMVDRLIPEEFACLVMMSVVNGTEDTVTAGLFAFDVTGNGQASGGNMFPQTAEADTMTTAQIILPGADCANVQVIEGGQLNCKIVETGETCLDVAELRDGVVDFTGNDEAQ